MCALVTSSAPNKKSPLQLWYWHHSDLTTDEGVRLSKALIDRAARCGYTGLAFWDNSFGYLSEPFWPKANIQRLRGVIEYATAKGLQVMGSGAPFGWSNAALTSNGNMAEGQRVLGAIFQVDRNGKQLDFVNSFPGLNNAGFEAGRSEWFDTGDPAIGLNSEAHTGKQAAVIVDTPGNARFRQKVTLTPWRQYHLTIWFKSKDFRGPAAIEVLDWWHRRVNRFYTEIPAAGTHGWTKLDVTFDSQDTRWAYLYFGIWGKSSGILWFDDVQLEETAPVYVIRRSGTPLRIYDPDDEAQVYREGRDYNYVFDSVLSAPRVVFRDLYHSPVRITLPAGTRLRPGQKVAMDYYAVFPIPQDQQVGMCLTDPGVFRWLEGNARALKSVMPGSGDVLLVYDEMRQANSCAGCREKKMSAGELLAWNVEKTAKLYSAVLPRAPLYVWSDMFDPAHNAHDHYYYVEGDLAGSWKGLPAAVGVLNWNHPHLRESLEWFAGSTAAQPVPHKQIIAGYYDSGKGDSAEKDLQVARDIRGIEGIMYVTWRDDYSQLENFATSATQAWSSYQASVADAPRN